MSSPAVPAKSQPLHNFSLPMWKWHAASNHHQRTGRRLSPAPFIEAAAWRQSPGLRDSASEQHRKAPTADRDHVSGRSEEKIIVADKSKVTAAVEEDFDGVGAKEGKSKIYIRLRGKNKCDGGVQNQIDGVDKANGAESADDLVGKSWNLRPRKPMRKVLPSNGNGGGKSAAAESNSNRGFSQQQTVPNRQEGVQIQREEKKVAKQKFSIYLNRQEIEEDIFVMTGANKPARRPRKRAKAVQKLIDNVCPGLWLGAITPDSYKVSEAPPKV